MIATGSHNLSVHEEDF